jgi:hypothetical protein
MTNFPVMPLSPRLEAGAEDGNGDTALRSLPTQGRGSSFANAIGWKVFQAWRTESKPGEWICVMPPVIQAIRNQRGWDGEGVPFQQKDPQL